jgi:putative ABC transport system substrate-binding protein
MKRRKVLTLLNGTLLAVLWSRWSAAQTTLRALRVGIATIAPRNAPHIIAFVDRMATLGFREGDNFSLEHVAIASIEGYDAGFRELARRNVDIFLTFGNEVAAAAARSAAQGRPVVLLALAFDPFAKGYAATLAHPGGNITGIFSRQVELAAKRVELIREALPHARRFAVLWDSASVDQAAAAQAQVQRLALAADLVEIKGEQPDYAAALASSIADQEPVIVPESPVFVRDQVKLGGLFLERRLPAIGAAREDAQAGALLSYGVSLNGALREVADYVARIAKGAKPSELPIEQPRSFELAVNLKTAKLLDISIPPALLARADEVIE